MRTLMAILLAASFLQAQEKPAEVVKQEPREAVIIPVKTLTGDSFDRLVNLLGVFQAQLRADKNLRTIIVYAPKDVVEQMRKVVNELDRPGSEAAIGRNIDMTLTFLKCSVKPASGAPTLPADLEPVARQLRAATQYKDIELWDIDSEIVNLSGGAIALGHPLGASGGRILGTLAKILREGNHRWGVAAICIGVGQGLAVVLENTAVRDGR